MNTNITTPSYVLYDCYPLDRGENPDFDSAAKTDTDGDGNPNIVGGILKAMDGTGWGVQYSNWAIRNASRVKGLVGLYHYFRADQDPVRQAEAYHWIRTEAVKQGTTGLLGRLIIPIVDVETGGERSPNARASASQWIDGVSKFCEKMLELEGRRVMLYGRSVMRDLGIRSKMGCSCVWNPSYTTSMVMNGITYINSTAGVWHETEWELKDVALWQCYGDGLGSYPGIPNSIKGLGKIDLSVHINGILPPTTESLRATLL